MKKGFDRIARLFLVVLTIVLVSGCGKSKFTVNFDSNGGSKVESVEVSKGSTVIKPTDPTKEGYIFDAWYLGDEEFDFKTKVDKDITLIAKWELKGSYKIKFDANGADEIEDIVVEDGMITELPEPTRTGYTFVGWFDEDDNEYVVGDKITSSIILKAKWAKASDDDETEKVVKYTIKFNSDGGSKVSSQSVKEEGTVKKPKNPTKTGYEFVEWQLNGKAYNFKTKVTKKITLVALWKKIEVTGVTVDVKSVDFKVGDTKKLTATIAPKNAIGTVKWSSSNTKVVTVDSNGNIKAVSAGEATITATVDGVKATVKVTVKDDYKVTFTAVYTGNVISGYTYEVTKNGVKFTDYVGLTCGNYKVTPKSGQMNAKATATSCTIKVGSENYELTATYKK